MNDDCGVIGGVDAFDVAKLGESGRARRRIAHGIERKPHISRGRRSAIVPAHAGGELEAERASIRGPYPRARQIGSGLERIIVPSERHEQGVPLDLPSHRMQRDEGIRRFEVGARCDDDGVGPASGLSACEGDP
jgi:hypothetical protein